MLRPRFFVPEATAASTRLPLPEDEAHHARNVLRLREGAALSVFDGRGHEWAARLVSAGKRPGSVVVEMGAPLAPVAEPPVEVTLAIGLLKGDQMDAVIRDATALGAAAVVPLITGHVAVPGAARTRGAAGLRWQRIAVAAAKQCGRAVVPAVAPASPLPEAIEAVGDRLGMICVEPARQGAGALAAGAFPRPPRAVVFVGPEGGWSRDEVDLAARCGVRLVHLGPRTLRAETVPTVLLAALWTVWGWTE